MIYKVSPLSAATINLFILKAGGLRPPRPLSTDGVFGNLSVPHATRRNGLAKMALPFLQKRNGALRRPIQGVSMIKSNKISQI